MDISWEQIEYRWRQSGDSYLLWLRALNRYLQLEEPAFQVFRKLASGGKTEDIAGFCESTYKLPRGEAKRFIEEVRQGIEMVFSDHDSAEDPRLPLHSRLPEFRLHSEKSMAVAGKIIRFSFADNRLERYIFPHFKHFEKVPDPGEWDLQLECLRHEEKVYLRVNQIQAFAWPADHVFRLKGEIFMQIINLVHDQIRGEWMSVIHAASVSKGEDVLLFPAGSGGGKSTLAALLMAHGCELLSDDFTPIALDDGCAYSFPAGISIKPGSFSLLEHYFPDLRDAEEQPSSSKETSMKYLLPKISDYQINRGHKVRALVFVQYDPKKDCDLERIPNLDALNDFLTESWIDDDAHVAERFMDWYFDIPCYALQYGNNQKAVDAMLNLLDDEA